MTVADLRVRPHIRFYVVVALMLITTGTGMATGFYLFFRLLYVLVFALAFSYIWVHRSVGYLTVNVDRRSTQVNVGEAAYETISLKNESRIPKQALEIQDLNEIPGSSGGLAVSLAGGSSSSWEVEIVPRKRGLYALGPIRIANTDPFGLFKRERLYGDKGSLTVYPKVHDLPFFEMPSAYVTGESQVRKRSHDIAPHASSVRDYASGDSLSRVHWNSTARLGRLMSKEFDLGRASEVWILLDLHGEFQAGDMDQSTDEYGASIAASLASRYLNGGLPVGFVAYGDQRSFLTAETGAGQFQRVLQLLAVSKPEGETPLDSVIPEEELLWTHRSSLVVVTSSPREAWVKALSELTKRGVKATAVLVDARTFGGDFDTMDTLEGLVAAGVLIYVVNKGDDIPTALSRAYTVPSSRDQAREEVLQPA